jgi:membrane associated rhomboid family serine protease
VQKVATMIFPIGDDNVKGGSFPYVSYGFIAMNVLIFLYQTTLSGAQLENLFFYFGSIPQEISTGQDLYTLLTSMFLHGGWLHLLGNMLFLWVFADNIEATIGNLRFLLFYLVGGLFAAFGHIYFNLSSSLPRVGASGAISAVLGAYLVMYPASRIKVLFFLFVFRVPALIFLGFWIYQQTISGIGELNVPSAQTEGVAWWAHIGGFAFGLLAGFYFRKAMPVQYALEDDSDDDEWKSQG